MKGKLIAGNWKMNKTLSEGLAFRDELVSKLEVAEPLEAVLFPSFLHLGAWQDKHLPFSLGAQNVSSEARGALTGEVSASMLRSAQVKYVLTGHSERRLLFGEADTVVGQKMRQCLSAGLHPVLCCGEPLAVRQAARHSSYLSQQVVSSLKSLAFEELEHVVLAYEPVWSIGTGKTPSLEQIEEVHGLLREEVYGLHRSRALSQQLRVLYGGSVTSANASDILSVPGVDGLLVGGASLDANSFVSIVKAAQQSLA